MWACLERQAEDFELKKLQQKEERKLKRVKTPFFCCNCFIPIEKESDAVGLRPPHGLICRKCYQKILATHF